MTLGVAVFAAASGFRPTRLMLDRLLPAPGEGPALDVREGGRFEIELYAVTTSGARYTARVAAEGDPGYQATAVMLGESALSLLLGGERLHRGGGVLTPAVACGDVLSERLRAAGFEISVHRTG